MIKSLNYQQELLINHYLISQFPHYHYLTILYLSDKYNGNQETLSDIHEGDTEDGRQNIYSSE